MDERLMQFRVGVMVLATMIIAGIMAVLFGKFPGLGKSNYELQVHFPTADGVSRGSPIKASGILIGRVTKTEIIPDQTVVVTLQLTEDYKIGKNQTVRIAGSPIGLGDADLQVIGKKDPNVPDYQPGEMVEGLPPADPKQLFADLSSNVGTTVASLGKTSDEIGRLAKSINGRLDENKDKFDRIVDNTEQTIAGLSKTLQGVQNILGDDKLKEDLRRSLKEIPEMLSSTRNAINDIQGAINSANRNITNLEGLTKPLGERGNAMVTNIDVTLERLASTLGQVEVLSKKLNSSQGTVGSLLTDNGLYVQLNEAASYINDMTRRLRPILDDARIVSDKLARDPSVVLRGVINPPAGTKHATYSQYEHIENYPPSAQRSTQVQGSQQLPYDTMPQYSQAQGQGTTRQQPNQQLSQQNQQPAQQAQQQLSQQPSSQQYPEQPAQYLQNAPSWSPRQR